MIHHVIDEINSAMMLPNDAALYQAPAGNTWSLHGSVIQGVPRGDAVPDYWKKAVVAGGNPKVQGYTRGPWTAITPWFVIYPAAHQGSPVGRVRVAVSSLAQWALIADAAQPQDIRKAKWQKVTASSLPSWTASYDFNLVNTIANAPDLSKNRAWRVYQLDGERHPLHGGSEIVSIASDHRPVKVLAVFSQIKAWLPDGGPGDQVMLSIGADYYPNDKVRANDLTGANYLPGAYGSRFRYITSTPQYFYAANVVDPKAVDERGNHYYEASNDYTRAGGKTYLTREELSENPPPVQNQP